MREVPVVRTAEVERAPPSPSGSPDAVEIAEAGLLKLGWPKKEAARRVEAAWRLCAVRSSAQQPIEAGDLLREAIRIG